MSITTRTPILSATKVTVLHGKWPGDRECIPIVVRFGSDAA